MVRQFRSSVHFVFVAWFVQEQSVAGVITTEDISTITVFSEHGSRSKCFDRLKATFAFLGPLPVWSRFRCFVLKFVVGRWMLGIELVRTVDSLSPSKWTEVVVRRARLYQTESESLTMKDHTMTVFYPLSLSLSPHLNFISLTQADPPFPSGSSSFSPFLFPVR